MYVNGDLVGNVENPRLLVSEIRAGRRQGLLSSEINIRYDEEMGEVIINCDEGRLRRPLLVIQEGRTIPAGTLRTSARAGSSGPTCCGKGSWNGSTPRKKRIPWWRWSRMIPLSGELHAPARCRRLTWTG